MTHGACKNAPLVAFFEHLCGCTRNYPVSLSNAQRVPDMSSLPRVKVAAAHAAPVLLDKTATAEKAVSIIKEAAR